MAWFFRAVEVDDRRTWACRHGLTEYDRHANLGHALEHLRELAAQMDTATEIFLHPIEGNVVRYAPRP